MPVNHTGWRSISGFYVEMDSNFRPVENGPYNIDTSLQADQESIVVPITGIYFISASVTILDPDESKFQIAIFDGGHIEQISLTTIHQFHAGQYHTLSLSSFVKLFAGEVLMLMITSPQDANYVVTKTTSLTFHYIGSVGSVPAYLANVESIVNVPSGGVIKPWLTQGKRKLFRSLYGMIIFSTFVFDYRIRALSRCLFANSRRALFTRGICVRRYVKQCVFQAPGLHICLIGIM